MGFCKNIPVFLRRDVFRLTANDPVLSKIFIRLYLLDGNSYHYFEIIFIILAFTQLNYAIQEDYIEIKR